MRFTISALALAASAAVVNAGTVTFWTLDSTVRTIYFTGNQGMPQVAPVDVDSTKNVTVNFPFGWIGNYYAIPKGQENKPGMLGEVAFDGWQGMTYFDVSAIVNPNDANNVRQMWPVGELAPMSGCTYHPCGNLYWHPDDTQTKVTHSSDLMCTLGSGITGLAFSEPQ
ncbi:hypothetical protein PT974_06868 [Cladobotryum mycophilum]|uniref:DNase1 protein n=1 Tax=Cladobotryum mycophilum TaxID=491253 RepID=A0ABR0SNF2_9HYPO